MSATRNNKNIILLSHLSIFTMRNLSWHGTYANITNKILILQIQACRAIHNLPFNTRTTEYFKNGKKLKLKDLYESQISKHMYKCLNLNANILPRHSDIHYYPTRNNNKFIAPKCNMRKS